MKFRNEKREITEEQEKELAAAIRTLATRPGEGGPASPPDTYWHNLMVRTNRGIDDATSPRALSISWAARVAIPGVVAVVCFLIGLHYYAPGEPDMRSAITQTILSLPPGIVDSLIADPSQLSESMSVADIGGDVFDVSHEQIAEYFLESGGPLTVMEAMPDIQAQEVLAVLAENRTSETRRQP